MRLFSWLLAVAVAASAIRAAFAHDSKGAWTTAQLSVARLGGSTASVGNIAIFAGGSNRIGSSGEWNATAILR
jgi:hypothetical protein